MRIKQQTLENQHATALAALENVFGKASDAGFGSAVFHDNKVSDGDIGKVALEHFRKFLGAKLNPGTESAWMSNWRNVFTRGEKGIGIIKELNSIKDPEAKRSVPLLTELTSDPQAGVDALVLAFDQDDVGSVAVFNIGDGEAMSGAMISAIYSDQSCCSVIALMD